MTKEFLHMAQELGTTSNPDHQRGAQIVHRVVTRLINKGLLPESFPFSDVLDIRYMGLDKLGDEPTHSRFSFDNRSGIITNLQGEAVQLSSTERKIFMLLFLHVGEVVPTLHFNQSINDWHVADGESNNVLRTNIRRIRAKCSGIGLNDDEFPKGYILSVRNSGYALLDPANPEHVKTAKAISSSFHPRRE